MSVSGQPVSKEPDRAELLQLYRIAIDEYHFQIQLNWQRSQYYFVLNAALIAAGGALVAVQGDRARALAMAPFVVGLVAVVLAILITNTQHTYYRATREALKLYERRLGLGDLGIRTTPSLGSPHKRRATVRTFNQIMFTMLGVFDLAGILYSARSFFRALRFVLTDWFS